MLKKLLLALMVGGALPVSNVLALGIGDIKVNSALNQPLDAEIDLVSSDPDELDNLSVELASPSAFERIKLDRPAYLNAIQFEITERPDGSPIVKLSSTETIREPFLDFLVELRWDKGRMLREYTVLLDPPVSLVTQPAPPTTTVTALPASDDVFVDTQDSITQEATGADDLGFPVFTSDGAVLPADASFDTTAYSGDDFGPVEAQQTLWGIATLIRPDDVSIQQMMLALFDANPDAFINGNIHLLKKGAILRVPEYDAVVGRSYADALAEVRQINATLFRPTSVGATIESPGVPEFVAPATGATAAASSDPELRIVGTTGTGSSAATSSNVQLLQRELALATESLTSQRLENEELKSRVAELESVVAEMDELRRLLEIRNAEMRQLQESLISGTESSPVTETMASPEVELAAEPAPTVAPAAQPVPEPKPVPTADPAPTTAPDSAMSEIQKYLNPLISYFDKIKNDPMKLSIVGGVLLILIALVIAILRKRRTDVEIEEDGEVDIINIPSPSPQPEVQEAAAEPEPDAPTEETATESKPSVFAKIAALFAGVMEKAQSLLKKKNEEIAYEDETAGSGAPPSGRTFTATDDATDITRPPEMDSSLSDGIEVSESSGAPMPAAAEDKAGEQVDLDLLEEIDVYEAFGDFEQAAAIVKQVIDQAPNNNSYKLRLFKIYEAGGMKNEFAQALTDYKDAMADSPEWQEVEDVRKTFLPDSQDDTAATEMALPETEPQESTAAPSDETVEIDFSSLDLDLAGAGETSAESDAPDAAPDEGFGGSVAPAPGSTEGDRNTMEFYLGDAGDANAAATDDPASGESPGESSGNSIEFELGDLGGAEAAATESAGDESPGEGGGNSIEFELDDLGGAAPAEESVAAATPAATPAVEDDGQTVELGMSMSSLMKAVKDSPPAEPAAEAAVDAAGDDGTALELDMGGLDGADEAAAGDADDNAATMQFDLGDLGNAAAPAADESAAVETPASGTTGDDTPPVGLDMSGLESLDAASAGEAAAGGDSAAMGLDMSGLESLDEAAAGEAAAGGDSAAMGLDMSGLESLDEAAADEAAVGGDSAASAAMELDMSGLESLDAASAGEAAAGGDSAVSAAMELDVSGLESLDAASAGESVVAETPVVAAGDDDDATMQVDLSDLGNPADESTVAIDNEIKFEADEPLGSGSAINDEKTAVIAENNDAEIEFEAGSSSGGEVTTLEIETEEDFSNSFSSGSGDVTTLELETEASSSVSGDATTLELETEEDFSNSLGYDLDSFGDDDTQAIQLEAMVDDDDDELDEADLSADLSEVTFGTGDVSDFAADEADLSADDLEEISGDFQEENLAGDEGEDGDVSTKLDLARAYIDMGDSEGAKDILGEVITEGNETQKAAAQELLQSA